MGNAASLKKSVNVDDFSDSCSGTYTGSSTYDSDSDGRSFRDNDLSSAISSSHYDDDTSISSCGYPSDPLSSRSDPLRAVDVLHYHEFVSEPYKKRALSKRATKITTSHGRRYKPPLEQVIHRQSLSSRSDLTEDSNSEYPYNERSDEGNMRETPATVECDQAFTSHLDETNMIKIMHLMNRPKTAPDIVQNIPRDIIAKEERAYRLESADYASSPNVTFADISATCMRCQKSLSLTDSMKETAVQCEMEEVRPITENDLQHHVVTTNDACTQSSPKFQDSSVQVNSGMNTSRLLRTHLFERDTICQKSDRAVSAKSSRKSGSGNIEYKRCKSALALLIRRTIPNKKNMSHTEEKIHVRTQTVTEAWSIPHSDLKETSDASVQCEGYNTQAPYFESEQRYFHEQSRPIHYKEDTFHDDSATESDFAHFCDHMYNNHRRPFTTSGHYRRFETSRPPTCMPRPKTVEMSERSQKRLHQIFSSYKAPLCRKCHGSGLQNCKNLPNHCGHQSMSSDKVEDMVNRLHHRRSGTAPSYHFGSSQSNYEPNFCELQKSLEHAKSTLLDISRIISNNLSPKITKKGIGRFSINGTPVASGRRNVSMGFALSSDNYSPILSTRLSSTPKNEQRKRKFVYGNNSSGFPHIRNGHSSYGNSSDLVTKTATGKYFPNICAMKQSVERLTSGKKLERIKK